MPESYQDDSKTTDSSESTPEDYGARLRESLKPARLEDELTASEPRFSPWPWYKLGDFFKPWEQTADADAARMMRLHAANLLYVERGNDFPYLLACADGTGVWERDPAHVDKLLAETGIQWVKDAADSRLDQKDLVAVAKWQTRGANRARRDKTLGSAGRVFLDWNQLSIVPPELNHCKAADLDSDRRYLGASNGVIDLDTGKLLTGQTARRKLVTRRVPEPFYPNAQNGDVDRIFAHLEQMERDYMLDAVAYAVRRGPARRIYVLLGPPRGGKSTALAAITAALGGKEAGYSMSIDGANLVQPRFNRPHGHQGGLFGIQDVLICSASELPAGRERLNRGLLKTFDGVQPVAVREVGEKVKDSRPAKGTIFLTLNASDVARLNVLDEAFRDRIKILPYPPLPGPQDAGFVDRVTRDPRAQQAMLAIIVRRTAAMNGQTEPPADPSSVSDAVNDRWTASIGEIGVWLKEHVVQEEKDVLFTDDLMDAVGDVFPEKEGRYDGRTRKEILALAADVCKLPATKNRRRGGRSGRAYDGFRLLSHDGDPSCKYCGRPFLAERGDPENAVCDACADHPDNQQDPPGAITDGKTLSS